MRSLAKLLAGTAFVAMAASPASAALVDFTDRATLTSVSSTIATGSADGVNFSVVATGGDLTLNPRSGPGPVGGLVGRGDGLGVGDDEIGLDQIITVVFDEAVRLTGALFLDLFRNPMADAERALVYAGLPPDGFLGSVEATEVVNSGAAGFGQVALSSVGTTFSFDPGDGNDGFGFGDFALGGLSFERIPMASMPLPAGTLLLATALGGFGLVRRRRA